VGYIPVAVPDGFEAGSTCCLCPSAGVVNLALEGWVCPSAGVVNLALEGWASL